MTISQQKRAAHKEKFRKIGEALSRYVTDPHIGITTPCPWRVRKSQGFEVMQIVSDPGMSKLEQRSLQTQDQAENE